MGRSPPSSILKPRHSLGQFRTYVSDDFTGMTNMLIENTFSKTRIIRGENSKMISWQLFKISNKDFFKI